MILLNLRKVLILSAFFISVFTSCKKPEEGSVGKGLLPAQDEIIGERDTTLLTVFTERDDSIRTDNASELFLGSVNDPLTGQLKCGAFFDVRLSSAKLDLGDPSTLIADSIVLFINFKKLYGDTSGNTELIPHIYEVNQYFDISSSAVNERYTSSGIPSFIEEDLLQAATSLSFKIGNVISVDDSLKTNLLRFKLKNSLAERILANSGTDNFDGNSSFIQNVLNGLYIETEAVPFGAENGVMAALDVSNEDTKLAVYYHTTTDSISQQQDFLISNSSYRFSTFSKDETSATAPIVVGLSSNAESAMVQGGGQLRSIIQIDKAFVDTNKGKTVNYAEIVLPIQESTTNFFKENSKLYLYGLDEEGNKYLLADVLESEEHVGGIASNGVYRFGVTRQIQRLFYGANNYNSFSLLAFDASPTSIIKATTVERVILNTKNTNGANPKLVVYFSEF